MKLTLWISCQLSVLVLVIAEEWSTWSECSRTCDGGAAYQLRRCSKKEKCQGGDRDIRYRACNTQSCPSGGQDFRSLQCSAYDDVTYQGLFYKWLPYYESRDLCSLRCEAEDAGFVVMLAPKVLDGTRCDQHSNNMCINGRCWKVGCDKVLGSTKQEDECGLCGGDGSTCKPNPAHDMDRLAADQPVTFHWLGELPKKDSLEQQKATAYVWKETEYSECSVSCGIGQQSTTVVCYNTRALRVVKNVYCPREKPPHSARTCKQKSCGPVWITGEWQQCSKTCGSGVSKRPIYCVEERKNASFQRMDDRYCTDDKPEYERKCNEFECPKWYAGEWSPCSSTCGNGHQLRAVVCRRTKDHDCSVRAKPNVMRRCRTGVPCMGQKAPNSSEERTDENDAAGASDSHSGMEPWIEAEKADKVEEVDKAEEGIREGGFEGGINTEMEHVPIDAPHRKPIVASGPPPTIKDLTAEDDRPVHGVSHERGNSREYAYGSEYTDYESFLKELGNKINKDFDSNRTFWNKHDYDYRGWEIEEAEEEESEEKGVEISATPTYVSSPWGKCSSSCLRYRIVECKVFLEFSQAVQTVADSECAGFKPEEVERCSGESCSEKEEEEVTESDRELIQIYPENYAWRFTGYGPCSAACMGGIEAPEFLCMRLADYAEVDNSFCAPMPLPKVAVRTCNDVPCPPRWRTYPFGGCSQPCGGGERRRRVECIQELGKGDDNVALRPASMCQGPAPREAMSCNLMDCPPAWKESEWTECSVTCGSGVQSRDVVCKQRVMNGLKGELLTKSDATCEHLGKPLTIKPCTFPACSMTLPASSGVILFDPSKYIQLRPRKKIMLTVGGEAVVMPTTKLAVRCPVVKFNKKHVTWKPANGEVFTRRGRVKVSGSGVLRINKIKAQDAGVYTCTAGSYTANITIALHSSESAMHKVDDRRQHILANHKFNTLVKDKMRRKKGKHRQEFTLPFIFDNFNRTTIPFAWMAGAWGTCSRTCGGAGLQSRDITCEVILESYTLVADDRFCATSSAMRPLETRDCGFHQCPEWSVGEWSGCTDEICMGVGKGATKRPLYCISHNGSMLDLDACDPSQKPAHKVECPKAECKPTWKTSPWTDCSVSCGGEGIRTRALQCVWVPNKEPAGHLCRLQPRPSVMKPCTAPSCTNAVCRDESKYCSLVPKMNLCRLNEYRRKCCISCMVYLRQARLLQ